MESHSLDSNMESFLQQIKLSCGVSFARSWKTHQAEQIYRISCLGGLLKEEKQLYPFWHIANIIQFCSLFEKFRRPGLYIACSCVFRPSSSYQYFLESINYIMKQRKKDRFVAAFSCKFGIFMKDTFFL